MPHIQTPSQIFAVTAVSYGTLTLTANLGSNTSDLYKGLLGNLMLGAASTPIVILEILSAGVVLASVPVGSGYNVTSLQRDLSAYNGGTLYFESQLVSVEDASSNSILITPTIDGEVSSAAKQQSLTAVASAFANHTDLDTGVAPTPGYIYRGTGTEGAVTKALADIAANADGIVGVGDATLGLRLLTVPGEVVFDSLPAIHTTAYLSATVAGQATCAMPIVARVVGTVDAIISAVAPFRATVVPTI